MGRNSGPSGGGAFCEWFEFGIGHSLSALQATSPAALGSPSINGNCSSARSPITSAHFRHNSRKRSLLTKFAYQTTLDFDAQVYVRSITGDHGSRGLTFRIEPASFDQPLPQPLDRLLRVTPATFVRNVYHGATPPSRPPTSTASLQPAIQTTCGRPPGSTPAFSSKCRY